MDFITKLGFDTRQVKQEQKTSAVLSGATTFGVPFSALTKGPDPATSAATNSITGLTSTFSGNSSTTVFTWYDNGMQVAYSQITPITSGTSGNTQYLIPAFTASTTGLTADGNIVALTYSGVSFDLKPTSIYGLGGGNYSGSVYTNIVQYYTAGTLDFTGRTIWVDVSGITRTVDLLVTRDATFSNIGSSASYGTLHYTSGGTLTTNTSDRRLKTNIVPISNALEKVKSLNGVYYNWLENPDGQKRIGFIAQDVQAVIPELVFTNARSIDNLMGIHYESIGPLLVEAIKELISGPTTVVSSKNVELHTQTIVAEDNNIQLNYGGTNSTALGGGIIVLNAINNSENAEFVTNSLGDWVTNNNLKPQGLIIPYYTPESSNDGYGLEGSITRDENYLYVKDKQGWKRAKLESF